jgi:hypothetical protein
MVLYAPVLTASNTFANGFQYLKGIVWGARRPVAYEESLFHHTFRDLRPVARRRTAFVPENLHQTRKKTENTQTTAINNRETEKHEH